MDLHRQEKVPARLPLHRLGIGLPGHFRAGRRPSGRGPSGRGPAPTPKPGSAKADHWPKASGGVRARQRLAPSVGMAGRYRKSPLSNG